MNNYQDRFGHFFGRVNASGTVDIVHADGTAATRIDASVYPVGSQLSARYEHPAGIVLTLSDVYRVGIPLEWSVS